MRQKMLDAHANKEAGSFDLKHDPGGIIDVEFMVQYLVLGHARAHPELTANLGNIALLRMAASLGLIPAEQADATRNAYREYRRLQHGQRLNTAPTRLPLTDRIKTQIATVRKLWRFLFEG
jgi:glutamate-ammonia-ligase adenylyltransferase